MISSRIKSYCYLNSSCLDIERLNPISRDLSLHYSCSLLRVQAPRHACARALLLRLTTCASSTPRMCTCITPAAYYVCKLHAAHVHVHYSCSLTRVQAPRRACARALLLRLTTCASSTPRMCTCITQILEPLPTMLALKRKQISQTSVRLHLTSLSVSVPIPGIPKLFTTMWTKTKSWFVSSIYLFL